MTKTAPYCRKITVPRNGTVQVTFTEEFRGRDVVVMLKDDYDELRKNHPEISDKEWISI